MRTYPKLPTEKVEMFCLHSVLPKFELFKLEFSECVFQADHFLLENLGQNWLAVSKPPGNKHSSLILKTDGFFFFSSLSYFGSFSSNLKFGKEIAFEST